MNMEFERKLAIPMEVKEQFPVTAEMEKTVEKQREEVMSVFRGTDDRMLLIIGPCSADREDAVLDYLGRMRKLADRVKDKVVVVPRIYTNKPRTTGEGYKGILHQPDPTGRPEGSS